MAGGFRIGTWVIEPQLNTVSRNGTTVCLEPKVMDVLVCLAQHAGEPVSKDELLQTVWPNTFVTEDGVKRAISELRRVFEDDVREPRIIQTIPKRGYRLLVSVEPINGAQAAAIAERGQELPKAGRNWRALALLLSGVAALLLIFAAALYVFGLDIGGLRSRLLLKLYPPAIHSLAVIPLQNLSNDATQEYFADGMTDALITDLAQIGSVKVISRTSSMQYKQTKKTLPEVARELNVDGIIEGTVQRSGDRVRITAQLIYGPSDKHVWANSYERDLRDIFALERDVTQDIARQVQARLTTKNQAERAPPRPMDPKALEAYLQGNYHLNKNGQGFGDEEKKKAAEYFQQAIDTDPNFALAYHGLVHAHQLLWLGSGEDVAIARKAGEKSLEIDPNYSQARVNLAGIKWQADLDWRGAEADIRRVTALDPKSAWAHSALCILLINLGNSEEGLRECRIAQRLDPLDDDSALGLYFGRQYDDSIAMLRTMLQPDPKIGLWHGYLFTNYAMKGMHKEAIGELAQCYSLYGFPKEAANIQSAFDASGYREAVRQWAKEMEHLQATHQAFLPGNLSMAYAILGDKDRAFYWLNQAHEHREMASFDGGISSLGAEPMFDPLRSDPRFKDLLRHVGLAP